MILQLYGMMGGKTMMVMRSNWKHCQSARTAASLQPASIKFQTVLNVGQPKKKRTIQQKNVPLNILVQKYQHNKFKFS